MAYRRMILAVMLLFSLTAIAHANLGKEFRVLKGTWMCPQCAALHQADTPENCEAKGHKHALKLDDGRIITFTESPRAEALIHGGGRTNAKIEVCGLYDAKAHTLDVDAYKIDKKWSTWCPEHGRMDFCRAGGDADQATKGDGKGN